MDTVTAGDAAIPRLGLGTWQLGDEDCRRAVRTALELGYRHVDTAQLYDNERAVGEGLAAADVDREEVFLTTKLWRSNLRADDVRSATRESLDRLGVDAVDLLLIHWPHPRVPIAETIEAMTALVDDGLVRHVGVSNFTAGQLREAIDAAERPIVANQVRYHCYADQSALLETCREEDVALTAYSPLARGQLLDDPVVTSIAEDRDRSPAQIALRWLLEQDGVAAIPKATSREHIADNLGALDVSLTAAERERLDGLQGGGGLRPRLWGLGATMLRHWPL